MFGFDKHKPIAEHEASGEIERVYHEIKQTLRVTGVNLNFRSWAGFDQFLPLIWDTLRPSVETREFELAADQIRGEAAHVAESLGPLNVPSQEVLGESQLYQLRRALDLYHYVNPKLLVFTSAVACLLRGEEIGHVPSNPPVRVPRGAPLKMLAMEMETDDPDDDQLQSLYSDIKETLSIPSVNSDYRTLALWPDYLTIAWQRLKPVVQLPEYRQATEQLRETSRRLARGLPYRLTLDLRAVEDACASSEAVIEKTESFEQLLPGLIVNIALLQLDWQQGADLYKSPYPIASQQFEVGGVR